MFTINHKPVGVCHFFPIRLGNNLNPGPNLITPILRGATVLRLIRHLSWAIVNTIAIGRIAVAVSVPVRLPTGQLLSALVLVVCAPAGWSAIWVAIIYSSGFRAVTLANRLKLVRVRMFREAAVAVRRGLAPAGNETAEAAKAAEAALGSVPVAGGVVVGRAGAEALLLAVVAGQGKLNQNGEDEEEAGGERISIS